TPPTFATLVPPAFPRHYPRRSGENILELLSQNNVGKRTASAGTPVLVTLHLDHKIGEPARTIEQNLMRHFRRDANNIVGRELPANSAQNRAITPFMWLNRLAAHHRA